MIVFRLCKSKYSRDLSGSGAEKSGARWNSKGKPMLYTSATRALCMIEIAVHTPLGNLPSDFQLISIEFPDNIKVFELDLKLMPRDWKQFPHPNSTQLMGDKFISNGKFLVMKAPSVVVQGEWNYLFNPNHKDFNKVKVVSKEDFVFDERLFVKK